ncbi:MAG TPA: hypothetical protein VFF63_06685 [Candidatus Babeliales bacterium]|nr:hypothetical protein [Candidatus Babeliales bacterium]
MRSPSFWRASLLLCAGALGLGACGAGTPEAATASGASDGSRQFAHAKAGALLYVSDLGANAVDVFTYPSAKLVGKLTGFGSVAGLCSDKAGDVFVVDEAGPVDVYAHGGSSPIRKLTASGAPYGCSVDPVSGDLALTQLSSYLYGAIAIYPKAQGKPQTYNNDTIDSTYFCGYDENGNLLIDGVDRSAGFILIELPKGARSLRILKFGKTVQSPGGVQWDGKYFAVGDRGGGVIYRASDTGNVVATVKLGNGTNVEQFWIAGSTLIGPSAQSKGTVPFWAYPAGGAPVKTLSGFYYPFGATVSVAR